MSGAAGTTASGAAHLVAALERLGVEVVFGLPGVHNLPIWEALATSRIRLIGVRHEQTAAFAADGYARATGRLGVAIVTTGPGAANTLAATGEAMASGSPILVIATDVATTLRTPGMRRGVIHEARDQAALFAPLVKRAATLGPDDRVARHVVEAARLASRAPSGPVYLGVPTDLLARIDEAGEDPPDDPELPPPDKSAIEQAADMIDGAERVLIWAGGGALRSGAGEEVARLAERIGAAVVTTFGARGLLPPDHPCAVAGPVHVPEVGALWDEADLVIAVGTDFDGPMTQNWAMPAPGALLTVNVDPDDASKNYRPDLLLVGDAREVVGSLCDRVGERASSDALRTRRAGIDEAVRTRIRQDDEQAAAFLDVLERVVPPGAVYVVDMCIPGYWIGGFLPIAGPRKLAYPLGWGTLGFGLPAAVGAAAAGIGRVVCVCGDGGFLFACGELATLAQERLPVTTIIVDDGGYGMLRFDQEQAGVEAFGVDLHTPRFADLARSFGIRAEEAEGFGEPFAGHLAELVADPEPNVLVVRAALRPPLTTSARWYRRP